MEFLFTDPKHEIFRRLTCKDIVRCKCVCREWYNLLSDPNFTMNYRSNSSSTSLFLINYSEPLILLECAADEGIIKTHINIQKLQHINCNVSVVGSDNGLLFFWRVKINFFNRMVEKVYCCNPLLRGCFMVAKYKRHPNSDYWPWHVEYKLGYISSTNKFKLLRIAQNCNWEVEIFDIFTVGVDHEWRRIEDHPHFSYRWVRSGVCCFNGAYHYIFNHESTFDLIEEKNGRVWKLPDFGHGRKDLVVLNNHLSLIHFSDDFDLISVWRIKEYGVAESWCRNIVIKQNYASEPSPDGGILFLDFICRNILDPNPGKEQIEYNFQDIEAVVEIIDTLHIADFAPRFYSIKDIS